MKKILKALIISGFILAVLSFTATAAKISVDGVVKELPAYNIKNNNYFKLRDVAIILNGTEAQFDVQWNEDTQRINLASKTPYSGTESINPAVIQGAVARNSDVGITLDGLVVLSKAYNINFNNYFKLRDLGAILNFNVTWDENAGLIGIDTKTPYDHSGVSSSAFALNTKYISLIGKRKAEIDSICGAPATEKVSMYTELFHYPCGVTVNYGWTGSPVTEYAPIHYLNIRLSELFFNCPETVTIEQVKALFVEAIESSSGLSINYCGKSLSISFENGVAKSSDFAMISPNISFESTITEVVYVGAEWANTLEKTEGRIAHEFVLENMKEIKVPGGKTHSYENVKFELVDVSGDGISELMIEVYDEVLNADYRALYVRKGNKFEYVMGGTNFNIVHNYIENVYYIEEYDYIDGEEYYKNTNRYYSWAGMNKKLILEQVTEYKNYTDYYYYNGVLADNVSEEKLQYYRNFVMFYPVYLHSFDGLLHSK